MGLQTRVDGNSLQSYFPWTGYKEALAGPMQTSTYTRNYTPASFSAVTSFRSRANNAILAAGLRGGTPRSLQRRWGEASSPAACRPEQQ